ncbi:nucleotide sugar dehydrogenase, partial [Coxiella burnetii]
MHGTVVVGFYGMTHLGLVSAVAAASKGYQVIGYDPNETLIAELKQKKY